MASKWQGIGAILDRADTAIARDKKWILSLIVFAFLCKLLFVFQSADSLQVRVPILDAKYYNDMAQDIARGHIIRREAFFMGPLYPYFMAVVYSIFGQNLMLERIVQMLGGSLTIVLSFFLGCRLFRPSVALLGAAMLSLYGAVIFYEGQCLMMWLGTLINMALLVVLHAGSGRRDYVKFALAGILLGLSSLARANILVFLPVVAVWIVFIEHGEKRARYALVCLACAGLTILPATVHNYIASKDVVLITSNGGINFYIGNNEEATGAFYAPEEIDFISDATTRKYIERLLGRDMKPSEVSSYWLRRSLEFIRDNPIGELRLFLKKLALFFNGYELPQIESFEISKERFGILRLFFVNFWFLSSLGLVGMLYTVKEWRKYFLLHWFIISYSLSIVLFFVTARYRIQLAPVLVLFASYSLLEVFPNALGSAQRKYLPLALLSAFLYFTRPGLFALDRSDIYWREHIHQGRRLDEIGRAREAIREIGKAIELRPQDPESYIHRAIIWKRSGKLFQSIEDYTRALKLNPEMPTVHYDLAQALMKAGMYQAAIEEYLKAIALDSLMVEAYNNLGVTYTRLNEYAKAKRSLRKALALDPGHTKVYNNLGACLAESGDVDSSIVFFKEAIKREPDYPSSYKNLSMAYVQVNKLDAAIEHMERYLELSPDDQAARETLSKIRAALEADTAK